MHRTNSNHLTNRGFQRMYVDRRTVKNLVSAISNPSKLSWPRTPATIGAMTALSSLGATMGLSRGVDDILFSEYKNTEVEKPVFIIANPRSGTTFLHRMLCMDEERFTYLKLWQTLLPSVSAYRAVQGIGKMDALLGSPLLKTMRFVESKAFQGWDGVHAVGLERAEEEEMYFIYAYASPSSMVMFPWPEEMEHLAVLDDFPGELRNGLMQFYRQSLQRHVFAEGKGRTVLSKNVFSSGRIQSILEEFPDARIINPVRHPYEALASFCSMFVIPWRAFAPEIANDPKHVRVWAELGVEYYKRMMAAGDSLPKDRYITMRYDELVADPSSFIGRIYERFDWPMSAGFKSRLEQATHRSRKYTSTHHYTLEEFGLTREWIYEQLSELFERYGFDKDYDPDAI